jgi:predicted RNA-binding protein with PUA-like domain
MPRPRRYWLFKTEPTTYSFEDLWGERGRTTRWEGVRNHQAKLLLRDQVAAGDGVLVYHSSADPTGVAGLAEVTHAAYPDPSQFDRSSAGFDPRSAPTSPTWLAVDVRATERLPRFLSLAELRASPALKGMALLKRGNRLSIQPVGAAEWRAIRLLAGLS